MKGNLWFFCLKLWVESWILCKFPFYHRLLCTSNLTFDSQIPSYFPLTLFSILWKFSYLWKVVFNLLKLSQQNLSPHRTSWRFKTKENIYFRILIRFLGSSMQKCFRNDHIHGHIFSYYVIDGFYQISLANERS